MRRDYVAVPAAWHGGTSGSVVDTELLLATTRDDHLPVRCDVAFVVERN